MVVQILLFETQCEHTLHYVSFTEEGFPLRARVEGGHIHNLIKSFNLEPCWLWITSDNAVGFAVDLKLLKQLIKRKTK